MFNTHTEWLLAASAGSIALVRYTPQYSIAKSYFWTALIIYLGEFLVWAIYGVVLYPRYFSPLRHLPGPSGNHFLFGQTKLILNSPTGIPLRHWVNTIPNDGLIRYLFLGNKERVLLTSPKALAEVLVTKSYQFIKPPQIRFNLARILGEGVLIAEGDAHKAQRRNLLPAFSFRHVKNLYPVFWEKGMELNVKLDEYIQAEPESTVEVGNWVSRATLDIIGLAGMGKDFGTLENPNNELSNAYNTILTPTKTAQFIGLLGLFFPPEIIAKIPVTRNMEMDNAAHVARQTARDMITWKKAQMKEKADAGVDIVSVALKSGFFSDEELVDQMMTFLLAGHETTSTAMQWAMHTLSKHPEIQTRLRNEIHANISATETPTAEKLDSLSYLHAFCQEVLRVHAPVPLTLRIANEDTTILGQLVPKGTTIIPCMWAINMSTELWGPDAAEFKPERWLSMDEKDSSSSSPRPNNNGGAKSNYAFLTFIHGPRSCIGQGFAVAEFKALVATWVGQFECTLKYPDQELEVKGGGATARPKGGIHLILKKTEWPSH